MLSKSGGPGGSGAASVRLDMPAAGGSGLGVLELGYMASVEAISHFLYHSD